MQVLEIDSMTLRNYLFDVFMKRNKTEIRHKMLHNYRIFPQVCKIGKNTKTIALNVYIKHNHFRMAKKYGVLHCKFDTL